MCNYMHEPGEAHCWNACSFYKRASREIRELLLWRLGTAMVPRVLVKFVLFSLDVGCFWL